MILTEKREDAINAFFKKCMTDDDFKKNKIFLPWLAWLSGLSAGLQTKRLLVQFPVKGTCLLWARSPAGDA